MVVILAAIVAALWCWWTYPKQPDHSRLPSLYSEIG
jgi:hypothetical protein